MRYTKLGNITVIPAYIGAVAIISWLLLPNKGISIFLWILVILVSLWIIPRIWIYQPSTEIEKRVRLTTLKLGLLLMYTGLILACISLLDANQIVGELRDFIFVGASLLGIIGQLLVFRTNTLKKDDAPISIS